MRPYFFLTLAPLLWAGNFVFGKSLSEALPPFGINLLRWAMACVVLVTLTFLLEGRFPRPGCRLWLTLAGIAITGVLLFNALVYLSLKYTTSTNAALILGAAPILTMVLAAAFGSEKLTPRGVAGALVCLVGIAWIICRGSVDALLNVSFNLGDIVMTVAVLCWAVYTALIRSTRQLSQLGDHRHHCPARRTALGSCGRLPTGNPAPRPDHPNGYHRSRLRRYLGLGGGLHGLEQRHQQHRCGPRFAISEPHSSLHPPTCLACSRGASRIGSDCRGLVSNLWGDAGIVRGLEAH